VSGLSRELGIGRRTLAKQQKIKRGPPGYGFLAPPQKSLLRSDFFFGGLINHLHLASLCRLCHLHLLVLRKKYIHMEEKHLHRDFPMIHLHRDFPMQSGLNHCHFSHFSTHFCAADPETRERRDFCPPTDLPTIFESAWNCRI
jgi:hypothetical protein